MLHFQQQIQSIGKHKKRKLEVLLNEKKNQYVKGEVYHTGCFGIKKKTFLSLNGFEPWICAADGEFHWRLKSNQHSSNNTSDIGLYYRRHGDNLTMAGNTGMNSPLRKKYHLIKNQKIKNNQSGKLDILNVSDFLQITKENISNYYPIFQKLNIKPNSFDNLQDRSKIEDELSKKQNIILPSKIVEKTNKQIDYNKINEIFEEICLRHEVVPLNIGLLFSKALNVFSQKQRCLMAGEVLRNLLAEQANSPMVFIKNIEVLFCIRICLTW